MFFFYRNVHSKRKKLENSLCGLLKLTVVLKHFCRFIVHMVLIHRENRRKLFLRKQLTSAFLHVFKDKGEWLKNQRPKAFLPFTRVEAEWLSCKNLQVSGRNLQGDASPCKFFFPKLASSYKLTIRLASSYKLTIQHTRLLQVNLQVSQWHIHHTSHTHHARTHSRAHTYTHTYTRTYTHTRTHTHARTHTHINQLRRE